MVGRKKKKLAWTRTRVLHDRWARLFYRWSVVFWHRIRNGFAAKDCCLWFLWRGLLRDLLLSVLSAFRRAARVQQRERAQPFLTDCTPMHAKFWCFGLSAVRLKIRTFARTHVPASARKTRDDNVSIHTKEVELVGQGGWGWQGQMRSCSSLLCKQQILCLVLFVIREVPRSADYEYEYVWVSRILTRWLSVPRLTYWQNEYEYEYNVVVRVKLVALAHWGLRVPRPLSRTLRVCAGSQP